MAIDTELCGLLLQSRSTGVSFEKCITLGRQHYLPSGNETRSMLRKSGYHDYEHPKLFENPSPFYSEPFWELLGAKELVTLDASDFEGASLVHDLNRPVPAALREHFDAVCDIGTLEHIFNFPMAIRNALEMVKVGGHFFTHTPANNYFGHGFYQFSPELFFRVLSARNGFRVERAVAVEYGPRRRKYEVADPEAIRQRVNLINSFPVLLFVQAKRIENVPMLQDTPQQSDYLAMWTQAEQKAAVTAAPAGSRVVAKAKRFLLERAPWPARHLEALLFSSLNPSFSFRNRRAFRRLPR